MNESWSQSTLSLAPRTLALCLVFGWRVSETEQKSNPQSYLGMLSAVTSITAPRHLPGGIISAQTTQTAEHVAKVIRTPTSHDSQYPARGGGEEEGCASFCRAIGFSLLGARMDCVNEGSRIYRSLRSWCSVPNHLKDGVTAPS